MRICIFFFFSSRRRHTRWPRDWSSDVCSSDLATVILKRGMTSTRDLWKWFQMVGGGGYAYRLSAEIAMQDPAGKTVLTWGLDNCLPVKFKAADLNAKGTEVGIEELHLAHEGLRLVAGG